MPRTLRFGHFEVDLRSGELLDRGRRVPLPDQSFRVLAALLANAGEVVTRDELRERVWPAEVHVDFDHALANAVQKIRAALGDSATEPRWVETLPRRGYRFLAPVEPLPRAGGTGRGAAVAALVTGLLLVGLLSGHRPAESKCDLTRDPNAREAYLRGVYLWNQKTPEAMEKAAFAFENAARLDPEFAPAHAGRARAYHFLGAMGMLSREEAVGRTSEAAERALALDPSCGQALAILAESRFRFQNLRACVGETFQHALRLKPADPDARQWYANFLASEGRLAEAVAEMQKAQQLDPVSRHVNADLAILLFEAGRPKEAWEQFHRTLELDPDYPKTHFLLGHLHLREGRIELGLRELRRTVELDPETPKYLAALGAAYADAGHRREAEQVLARLRSLQGRRHVPVEALEKLEASVERLRPGRS